MSDSLVWDVSRRSHNNNNNNKHGGRWFVCVVYISIHIQIELNYLLGKNDDVHLKNFNRIVSTEEKVWTILIVSWTILYLRCKDGTNVYYFIQWGPTNIPTMPSIKYFSYFSRTSYILLETDSKEISMQRKTIKIQKQNMDIVRILKALFQISRETGSQIRQRNCLKTYAKKWAAKCHSKSIFKIHIWVVFQQIWVSSRREVPSRELNNRNSLSSYDSAMMGAVVGSL